MLECKNKCGWTGETTRAKVAHETHKCRKRVILPCECADGGEWALLNRQEHAAELSQGYKKYCTVCKEAI